MKRALSLILAMVMVLSLVPAVHAAEDTVLINNNGLYVAHGATQLVNDDGTLVDQNDLWGTVAWDANGNNVTAVAYTEGDRVGSTLTIRNDKGAPATLRFEYAFVLDVSEAEDQEMLQAKVLGLDGESGKFERELAPGESYTITIISADYYFEGELEATLTLSGISLSTGGNVNATFKPAEHGSYTLEGAKVTADVTKTGPVGTSYAVSAKADDGYQFFGWYTGSQYLSYNAEGTVIVTEDCSIWPVFIKDTVAVFGVGETKFQDLSAADAAATASQAYKTIVLLNDGILTGEHTVSAGNTLLIPYDNANTVHTAAVATASINNNPEWETPSAFRTLTMAKDAKITVYGSLNVGGMHSAGPNLTAGSPTGDLGMIQMAEGANITVDNGGILYCWGYIYGDGTVTVKNGGTAHENFQFTDFRGGTATLGIAQTFIVFPLSQYYVQNVEVAMTFEHGASEYVWGSIFMSSDLYGTAVKFIGDNPNVCMFVPGVNGTVTKTYDPKTDRLIIDVDGNGSINPMGLELGGMVINTATFVLPINSNMTINVNSGVTNLNQSLALLPGSVLNVAEGATLTVQEAEPLKKEDGTYVHYTGGNNLIVYDRDQWLKAYQPVLVNGQLMGANSIDAYFVYAKDGMKRLQPVAYSPTRSYTRTEANLQDAVVDINGKLITDGYIYTTVDIDLVQYFYYNNLVITSGGAAVKSSNGTGKLVMNHGAGKDSITLQPIQKGTETEFAYLLMSSARLQNADGTYLDTYTAQVGAEYTYCAGCGKWSDATNAHDSHEITWIVDGVPSTQEVCANTRPVYNFGTDPVKEGYTFIGWSTGNDNEPEYTSATLPVATGDAVYYACFEQEAAGMLGDFDGDGEVTAEDLTLLARHIAGIEDLTDQAMAYADVDGSGEVDAEDLTQHARYVAGIIDDWTQE